MKVVRNSYLIGVLLLLFSCNKKIINSSILGSWNLIHIYENQNDLLGNDLEKSSYYFRSLFIEKGVVDQLTMQINRNEYIYCDFKIINDTILNLSRSTQSKFDGDYLIKLKDTTSEFFSWKAKSISLIHLNKDLKIYGLIPKE